jgi:two-component system, chemotaxis family, sensor kinase CheA
LIDVAETLENAELLNDFVEESLQSLRGLAEQLQAFQQSPEIEEPIHAVFRAVHSVKGCAGFLDLKAVKEFAHSLENTLDEVRKKKLTLTPDLCRALIDGFDLLEAMIVRIGEGQLDEELSAPEETLLLRVAELCSPSSPFKSKTATDVESSLLSELKELAQQISSARLQGSAPWVERLQQLIAEHDDGIDDQPEETTPSAVLPAATPWATATFTANQLDITPQVRQLLTPFVAMEAKQFTKAIGEVFLREANEVAAWFGSQNLLELQNAAESAIVAYRTLHNSPLDIDAVLLSIVWEKLANTFAKHTQTAAVVSAAHAPTTKTETTTTAAKAAPAASKSRVLRVREEKLDEFLKHVSSLFITSELYKDVQSRISQTTDAHESTNLVEEFRQINRTFAKQTNSLQKSILSLRRVNAGTLFSKFPGMARTLAGQLNKQIEVQVHGEDVEIDKSLVEELDSPLTHMIRNVVDHGIELPADRAAQGKSAHGNLSLRAEVTKTHVVITIQDDGRGIDPNRLRRKVIEKGLLTEAQANALSDQEAVELIFMAGLSTAEQVSEISGRGVGLDVVRTTLRAHDGDVQVESNFGHGTTFRLEVPLSEAVLVINGLLIEQATERMVLPFEHVREICEISPTELRYGQGQTFVKIREQLFHTISLSQILDFPVPDLTQAEKLVLIQVSSKKYGDCCLIVDRIIGHRQVVVNSLRDILPVNDKISGVAQLGGGRLALVLSVPDLMKSLC